MLPRSRDETCRVARGQTGSCALDPACAQFNGQAAPNRLCKAVWRVFPSGGSAALISQDRPARGGDKGTKTCCESDSRPCGCATPAAMSAKRACAPSHARSSGGRQPTPSRSNTVCPPCRMKFPSTSDSASRTKAGASSATTRVRSGTSASGMEQSAMVSTPRLEHRGRWTSRG